ncbi:hypothetical protein [Devosia rhizoryzae]|uniref:Uncharacterized protein n=1 Tax=Devosia rhizoryzae TaxID=2774137 RepID=A0ABX7CCE0_9HYPH|nr:hypothetical protein [Devosia rhizoryzae]QQR40270.1 hypothetical protein JI748_04460 [Devosia rhizoryzae]
MIAPPVLPAGSPSVAAASAQRGISPAPLAPPSAVEKATANLTYNRRPAPDPVPDYEPPSAGATFAAAVLSGALAPTPQTLSEFYARIGASDIPEESELRLRDLEV